MWLELLLHPTVALVFEADPPSKRLMHRPPRRRDAGLLRREQLVGLLARGLSLTVAVLALYLGALGLGETEDSARGLALVALIVGQLLPVLVERSDSLHAWHRLSDNRVLPWIVAFTLGSLVLAELVPAVATRIHVTSPVPGGMGSGDRRRGRATLWVRSRRPTSRARKTRPMTKYSSAMSAVMRSDGNTNPARRRRWGRLGRSSGAGRSDTTGLSGERQAVAVRSSG